MTSSIRWGAVLGFALGGFFDGILLHQVLQWHHLLSLVPGVETLRAQVLWDGYFHALMYLVALIGLYGLWRNRAAEPERNGVHLLGSVLVGFGLWHLVDAVLSHWLLGIHRIKLDSPNPLAWDLVWLAGFGLLPFAAGWLLLRRSEKTQPGRGSTVGLLVAGLVASGAAAASAIPPPEQKFITVVFAPGVKPAGVMDAIVATEGRLVWADPAMGVVVVDAPAHARWDFYAHGALLVSGAAIPSGCFNWSKAVV